MDADQKFYEYQTRARGVLSAEDLERRFNALRPWYRCFFRDILPAKNARILDVPCGFGNILHFLDAEGFEDFQGVDSDPNQIELAKLLQLPAAVGDAFEVLEQHDASLDCIFSVDFLEHIPKDAAVEFLMRAYKSLAPGGTLILRTPSADGPFGSHDAANDITHKWVATANILRALLEMEGFRHVEIRDERPQPYSFKNRVRLLGFYLTRFWADLFCRLLGLNPPQVWSRSMWAFARKGEA